MAPFDRIVVMAFLVIARFVPRDCQVVPTAVTNPGAATAWGLQRNLLKHVQ
jgi:hypothetical protein